LSYVYRQDLNWLVSEFAVRVADVAHAAVVSADGVPLALSEDIPEEFSEQLAAITSGLASLMQGAARIFEAGMPSLAVLASPDCDTDLISYEMSLLVEAVGEVLTPAIRGGQQSYQRY